MIGTFCPPRKRYRGTLRVPRRFGVVVVLALVFVFIPLLVAIVDLLRH